MTLVVFFFKIPPNNKQHKLKLEILATNLQQGGGIGAKMVNFKNGGGI